MAGRKAWSGSRSPLADDVELALVAVAGELDEVFELFLAFVFAGHGLIAFVGCRDKPEEAQLEGHQFAKFFFPHGAFPLWRVLRRRSRQL